jgi:hypothetical protein
MIYVATGMNKKATRSWGRFAAYAEASAGEGGEYRPRSFIRGEPVTFPSAVRLDIGPALSRLDLAFHGHGFCTCVEPTQPPMLPRNASLRACIPASVMITLQPEFRILSMTHVIAIQ